MIESDGAPDHAGNGDRVPAHLLPDRALLERTYDAVLDVMHRLDQLEDQVKKAAIAAVVAGESVRHAQDAALDAQTEARGAKVAATAALAKLVELAGHLGQVP
jgi:hypothetical protein